VRIVANAGVRLLRRVLRRSAVRPCVGTCAAFFELVGAGSGMAPAGLLEVLLRHHAVGLHGDLGRVSQPLVHDVNRVGVHSLGLPARSQVVERLGLRPRPTFLVPLVENGGAGTLLQV